MTRQWTEPDGSYAVVEETVRVQLREAWERGLATAPHGVHALADSGAPAAFDAIMTEVSMYADAVVHYWRDRVPAPGKQASE